MKAILLKPLDGLIPGIYDIVVSDTTVWLDDNTYDPVDDVKAPLKDYDLFEDIFEDWFIVQVLPETITEQIRDAINNLRCNTENCLLSAESGVSSYSEAEERSQKYIDAAVSAVAGLLEGREYEEKN